MLSDTSSRRTYLLLGLSGIAYILAQFWFVPFDRYLNWDEAIYYSQIGDRTPLEFVASRARGIVWFIEPYAQFDLPYYWLRVIHCFVQSGLLLLAFGLWVPLIGGSAVGAFAIFSSTWLGLFYASEIMPNFPTAIFLLAVTALAIRPLGEIRFHRIILVLLFACISAIRPPDGVIALTGPLVILMYRRTFQSLVMSLWSGFGAFLGWLPWIIEAELKFGGTISRIQSAQKYGDEGDGGGFFGYLRLLDGPIYELFPTGSIDPIGAFWFLLLIALSLAGAWTGRKHQNHLSILAAFATSAAFFCLYVVIVKHAEIRYLIPSIALASIVAASALSELIGLSFGARRGILIVLATIGFVTCIWHVTTVKKVTEDLTAERLITFQNAQRLKPDVMSKPCILATNLYGPEFVLYFGCRDYIIWDDFLSDEEYEKIQKLGCGSKALYLCTDFYPPQFNREQTRSLWTDLGVDAERRLFRFDGAKSSICDKPS